MRIWVDADACPAVIKDILYRAAERLKIEMTLVANKALRTPPSPYIKALQVPRGIDVADSHIVKEVAPGDLVITADIPLASDVIAKGARSRSIRAASYIRRRTSRSASRCAITWTSCAARASAPAGRRRSTTPTASASRTSSTNCCLESSDEVAAPAQFGCSPSSRARRGG